MTQDTGARGSTYTVRANEFTPPNGMQFVAWNTQDDGLGTSHGPADTFALKSNVSLYAVWETVPTPPPEASEVGERVRRTKRAHEPTGNTVTSTTFTI